jgi:hypothetical protein
MLLSEIAQRIHDTDPSVPVDYAAGQARWLVTKGLIEPVNRRGSGRNALALLDATGMCRVKVFATLVRIGMVPDLIKAVPKLLENIADEPKPGKAARAGFARVVDGIASGEKDWTFTLHVMADGSHWGACSRKTVKPNPVRDPLKVASVTLPLNSLLEPLLKE